MARAPRTSKLETRTSRLKLAQRARHFVTIGDGLALAYRRTERGFGTWQARLWDGERYHYRNLGVADDYQDANGVDLLTFYQAQSAAKLVADEAKANAGIVRVPLTVGQAAENYLEWFRVHRKSVAATETALKAHILPKWGASNIADLRTEQIRAWHTSLASKPARKRTKLGARIAYREPPADDGAKRSRKSTANRILTIFKALLNKAYEDDLVASNEAWKKVKPFEDVDEPVVRFLKPQEAKRLLNACVADLRALVNGALATGARYSELAGAMVADYSPDACSLFIRPSKSGKGRHVPLANEGNSHFANQCIGKKGNELIFTRADGSAWGKNYQVRPLLEACQRAKIEPAIGFHELRHTYASLLAQAGADLLTISKLLGHADTRITSRHYAHLCDKTLANAVNRYLPSFDEAAEGNVSPIVKRMG